LKYSSAITWHSVDEHPHEGFTEPYKRTFYRFLDLVTFMTGELYEIDKGVGGGLEKLSCKDILELIRKRDGLLDKIETVVHNIKTFDVPRKESEDTLKLEFNRDDMIDEIYETGSHVVHILMKEKYLRDKLRSLEHLLRDTNIPVPQ
jgi:hypothetical protein